MKGKLAFQICARSLSLSMEGKERECQTKPPRPQIGGELVNSTAQFAQLLTLNERKGNAKRNHRAQGEAIQTKPPFHFRIRNRRALNYTKMFSVRRPKDGWARS